MNRPDAAADCLSCDVVAGRRETPGGVLYEDHFWHLSHQVSPVQLPGFLILQPVRHVEDIGELSPEEAGTLGPVLSLACNALSSVVTSERVYVCSFGSLVRHVHFYLVPRRREMPAELMGADLLREIFAGRWACPDEEAAAVAQGVKLALLKDLYL